VPYDLTAGTLLRLALKLEAAVQRLFELTGTTDFVRFVRA
jgi:hypothetical protein